MKKYIDIINGRFFSAEKNFFIKLFIKIFVEGHFLFNHAVDDFC
jgi:hypothetical protein